MKKYLLIVLFFITAPLMFAQKSNAWKFIEDSNSTVNAKKSETIYSKNQKLVRFDSYLFKKSLANATAKNGSNKAVEVILPNIKGELESFLVWESSNFEPELQAKFPEIRAYVGKGITDPTATLCFSLSPQNIQTVVFRADNGSEFIEPYTKDNSTYVVFDSKTRLKGKLPFNCATEDVILNNDEVGAAINSYAKTNGTSVLKTLRLALSCTGEYAQYFGGIHATVPDALAGMNATLTRCNGILEKDLAVKLLLIGNNDLIIYTEPATDPYSDAEIGVDEINSNNVDGWNLQLQNNLTTTIGNEAYDIGHLFGASGGGGNSGCIGCVCNNDTNSLTDKNKGSAFTSPANARPEGVFFDIDFVIHELGHQLGASHTFTHSYEGTEAQVEPGSGSTIMGYAGYTGDTDVQAHSDGLFAYVSINQIKTKLNSKACPVDVTFENNKPIVNAGSDYTIPKGTAFMLTGTGTDADNDSLTFIWEENDLGTSNTTENNSKVFSTKKQGPNFRIFTDKSSPTRYLPQMKSVLSGQLTTASNWETVYNGTTNRNLNFTFTARDNHAGCGQTDTDAMKVTVDISKGPFTVNSQDTDGISYTAGSTHKVTWSRANTHLLSGASTVDILLSTNVNGNETTFTTIKSGEPNDGSATVTLPDTNTGSTTCRFMVKPSGNIFFAVNSKNFTITPNLGVEDFGFKDFVLYPNPNKGSFTIQFEELSSDFSVKVYDLIGKVIYTNSFSQSSDLSQMINLENTSSGVYLINIKCGNQVATKKLIIQ